MPEDIKAKFSEKSGQPPSESEGYLDGQLLIAMPAMNDPNFEKSVIYICAHSDLGAVGLVINQRAWDITFGEILEQLEITLPVPDLPASSISNTARDNRPIVIGGPVETGRGFVLHSTDYCKLDATLVSHDSIGDGTGGDEGVGMTATLDILKAMAEGNGPRRSLLAIGYSGWGPGQLESEIQANGWLTCPAENDLVFDEDFETKWTRAVEILGVDPAFLSSDFGHA